jgi:hypothetical protein
VPEFEDVDLMIRLTKAVIDSTHLPVTVKLAWVGMTAQSILMKLRNVYKILV